MTTPQGARYFYYPRHGMLDVEAMAGWESITRPKETVPSATEDYYGIVLFIWEVTRDGSRGVVREAIAYGDAAAQAQGIAQLEELFTKKRMWG